MKPTHTNYYPLLSRLLTLLAVFGIVSNTVGQESDADIAITVVATRSAQPALDTAGSTTVVTSDDLITRGSTSIGEALKYEPGVSVPFDFAGTDGLIPYLGGGDQAINIRGLEANRISILIDGIRQPEDFVAQTFLSAGGPGRIYFDPAIFNQLELFKSASSSLYGSDAMGGTISGRTTGPESLLGDNIEGTAFSNSLTYASINSSINNRFEAAVGNGEVAASVVYSYRDGSERENNGDNEPNPQEFSSHAVLAKVLFKQEAWQLEGTVDYFTFENFTEGDAAEGSFFGGLLVNDNVSQDDERERLRFSVSSTFTPEDGLPIADTVSAQIYTQESEFNSLNIQQGSLSFGPFPSPRNRRNKISYLTDIYGLDAQADKLILAESATHTLRYGLEASWSDVESQFIRTDISQDGSERLDDRIGMAPSEVTRLGFFILDEITLGLDEKWVITPGLRFDSYEVSPDNTAAFLARTVPPGSDEPVRAVEYENDAFAPSLSVMYRWKDNLNTYFTYGRGIRNPSAEELNGVFTHGTDFIVVPNPDLSEETSNSFEIGLQSFGGENTFQIAGFLNQYDDFLESNVLVTDNPNPEPDVLTTVNLQEVETYGIEVRWDWEAGEERGSFEGAEAGVSLSWTEGERSDIDQPLNSVDPIKLVPYVGYSSADDRWGARLTGTYIGEKEEEDIDQTTQAGALDSVDSVFLLDIIAFVQLNDYIRINGGINNLTDESYFLWSTARRGGGHGGAGADRNTQPGLNGFLSVTASF